ncbi:F-box domain-containing protein [Mycena chlorophos]|uniref:F-box domain-containing protein n=1 Tax=Mycena chlorophos TaxID=658473 RepID=A0A8H6S537_MYCCL|nr:F-box domain-containing protein [Mycena chlorophos]
MVDTQASTAASRAADRATLDLLDADISRLETQLQILRDKRAAVHARLSTFIYPIQTLPTEIINEIFEAFVPAYPQCPPLLGHESPTNLTVVCRRWREIAVANPRLWRSICLDIVRPKISELDKLLESILGEGKSWLERSQPLSLSVVLRCGNESAPEVTLGQMNALDLLLQHCARWQFASLELPRADPNHPTRNGDPLWAPEIQAPVLVSLRIISRAADMEDHLLESRLKAPLLRTFHGRTRDDDVYLALLEQQWGTITSLRLDDVPASFALQALRKAPALTHCQLNFHGQGAGADHERAQLDCLQTLTLDSRNAASALLILDLLIAPSLKKLAIQEHFFADAQDLRRILTSWTALTSLECLWILTSAQRLESESGVVEEYRKLFPEILVIEGGDEEKHKSLWEPDVGDEHWDAGWIRDPWM